MANDTDITEYAQEQWHILNDAAEKRAELVKLYNDGPNKVANAEKWMERSSHVAGKDYISDKMKHPNMIKRDLLRMEQEIERLDRVVDEAYKNLQMLKSRSGSSVLPGHRA